MKKLIIELPTLTTPDLKEMLYVYLVVSKNAVSGVLVADRKGKKMPIRYFEAHPIKVITDQPIKKILNKPEVSGKLAKYAVELGAYNITYVPRNAIKGQVLADFINEVPVGTKHLEICSLADEESLEEWTLYMDRASSSKGVGVGLILINPTGTEYTYAIRLNFLSTNNEVEYEALLAGLRIAKKMKVRALKVKVDSKLVACQLNGEFVASSEGMKKYLTNAKEYVAPFKRFLIENIPRNQNQKADVLSKLASVAFNHLTKEVLVEFLNTKSVDVQKVNTIVEEKEDNWMTPIIKSCELDAQQCFEMEIVLRDIIDLMALDSISAIWFSTPSLEQIATYSISQSRSEMSIITCDLRDNEDKFSVEETRIAEKDVAYVHHLVP
ncbi:reverse transcriptase domain-containing protein [Tanacetum coccineum]